MLSTQYNPSEIESKWQAEWEKSGIYKALDNSSASAKPKYYVLFEFPYPSGERLHVGHGRSYSALDALARKKRMQGYNVLLPMGWDAFGLPAENYAIKMKTTPQEVVPQNIARAKKQAQSWGLSVDWSREVNTTDPNYYHWTQWIFLKMFERGLAYSAELPVNWCPNCKIGLANEEVVGGNCERCGTATERRNVRQWVLRITDYADRLIDDLELVDYLPKIKAQQVNWIGRSMGTNIRFPLASSSSFPTSSIDVFTTRADTIYGVTAIVVAPEHPIVASLLENNKKQITNNKSISSYTQVVADYVESSRRKSEMERTDLSKEKTGVFTGLYCRNPITKEEIPVWVGDYVIGSYGGGAVMVVPAHDARDFEFAKKYSLPIKQVIAKETAVARSYLMGGQEISDADLTSIGVRVITKHESGSRELEIPLNIVISYEKLVTSKLAAGFWNEYVGQETVFIFKDKSGKVTRLVLTAETAKEIDRLAAEYNGEGWTAYSSVWGWLADNDWYRPLIASTDYGVLINSGPYNRLSSEEAMEKVTVDLAKLNAGGPAKHFHLRDWVFSRQHYWGEPIPLIHCPKCGVVPVPEDQLPVVLPELKHYEPTGNTESPLAAVSEWVNVTCPKCGGPAKRDTDTMPNWAGSNWYYLGYVVAKELRNKKQETINKNYSSSNSSFSFSSSSSENIFSQNKELLKYWLPVDLYNGGMEHTTLHLLYSRFVYKFLFDLGVVPGPEPYAKRRSHGTVLSYDGEKMSKSRGNVINPDDIVQEFGADTFRVYEMFMGPFDQAIAWNQQGVVGVNKFLHRVWKLIFPVAVVTSTPKFDPAHYGVSATTAPSDSVADRVSVLLNNLVKKVSEDLSEDTLKFNTAVAAFMSFINEVEPSSAKASEGLTKEQKEIFLRLLAPFAPHIAEELWHLLGHKDSIHSAAWPTFDTSLKDTSKVTVVVQINGKVRGQIELMAEESQQQESVTAAAKEQAHVKELLAGQEIKKTIFVPGKLINFVV